MDKTNNIWAEPREKLTSHEIERAIGENVDKVLKRFSSPADLTLSLIKEIEWRHFELLCLEYFKAKNFKVVETATGKDGGVDLYLFEPDVNEADLKIQKPTTCIQCKSWQTRKVGVKVVRELYGVMASERISNGILAVAGEFTEDAIAFAVGKNIQLIDGAKLFALIKQIPEESQMKILARIVAGDYTTPTCPNCGVKLLKKTSKRGSNAGSTFWGCKNFPWCKFTLKDTGKTVFVASKKVEGKVHSSFDNSFFRAEKPKKIKGVKSIAAGLIITIVFVFLMSSLIEKMFSDIANNSIQRSEKIKEKAIERNLQQNAYEHPPVKNRLNEQQKVIFQKVDNKPNEELLAQKKIEAHNWKLDIMFDEQYIPPSECVNPSEEAFVQCVNYRRRARLQFFETHKLN